MKKFHFKNFNIADWFSFYRIAAAPFLLVLIGLEEKYFFAIFLLISFCTDAIDGFMARRLKITSARGSQLDSMGDQATFLVSIVALFVFEIDFIIKHFIWVLVPFILYFIQMFLAWIKYEKATAFHTYLAKISAITQAAFFLFTFFYQLEPWLFYIMIGIGVIETLEEITLIFIFDQWRSDVKGLYCALTCTEYKKRIEDRFGFRYRSRSEQPK